MFSKNFILNILIILQLWTIIMGFTINYTKNVYGSNVNNSLSIPISLENELMNIKADIEYLKQKVIPDTEKRVPFDIRRENLPANCSHKGIPKNCSEATHCTQRSGIYMILNPLYTNGPFLVECDTQKMGGGGWTVIQRRQDGSENFYRTWSEYKIGFGSIDGEFFIGLDKLYALTNYEGPQELLILMKNGSNAKEEYALYTAFQIGSESEKYVLKQTGQYSGTAGDSLHRQIGHKFSTKDSDNDVYNGNCAEVYFGAWWYDACHVSNLNGLYGNTEYAKGLTWHTLTGYYASLSYVQMMVRGKNSV